MNINSLEITGYESDSGGSMGELGSYTLQLNPSDISFEVGRTEQEAEEEVNAEGSSITSRAITFVRRRVQFKFTIDNTGAIPFEPDGVSAADMGSVSSSISKLEKLTVIPVDSTHRPPFVMINWGMGTLNVFGSVEGFNYTYTFFNSDGVPLRAEVSITVVELEFDGQKLFQSPDITKLPIVKEGDSIVSLSEKYYHNKKYYLKLAEVNNLSSFRRLKKGSSLEVPPIKKKY